MTDPLRAPGEKGAINMTTWERICNNLGLDAVRADPSALKILGPRGYIGPVETTCAHIGCGLVMEGQFARCIRHDTGARER